MFKNREFRIRMVNTKKENQTNDTDFIDEAELLPTVDPEQISMIAKDFVKHTGIVIGAVVGASMVLNAACQILINVSKSNDDE